ncbi:MAG: hypothetical protein WCF57_18785 [Pyrinomonadaceae bacterium]
MSEEKTEDISRKYDTRPTIETVLERIIMLEQGINARMDKMEERLGVRLDRIESEVKQTHSELYSMRADFTELRSEFNEFRSQRKQPV